MYYHHYPQSQFMGDEDAEFRSHVHPHVAHHPYHRYYEQPYVNQPMVSRFAIPHMPQQRPMLPIYKGYHTSHIHNLPAKASQREQNYSMQDENINTFNVKAPQQQECPKLNRKGISKKNNTPKNQANEKKQNEVIKSKGNKKEVQQREPLRMMSNENAQVRGHYYPQQQVFSNDPLVGSIQQFFPSVQIEEEINIDNASLEQIDALIKKLPFFYNNSMRDTMKNLTYKQEKLVCNKIKEQKQIDVFDEIVKLSPDFELKGLSMQQLNEKLQQINQKFEEQALKYQIQKKQDEEAELKLEEELLCQSEIMAPESPTFKKSQPKAREISTPSSVQKSQTFQSKTQAAAFELEDQIETKSAKKAKLETNECSTINAQIASIPAPYGFSSPKQQKAFCESLSEEKKVKMMPSSSECKRHHIRRNSESVGTNESGHHSQIKLTINVNQNLSANFISPFRPTINANIQGLSSNRKKLIDKSGNSCSSFKKTHSQFMDYIDDVIINADGNFGEDDIFHKLSNGVVPIYPISKSGVKNCNSEQSGSKINQGINSESRDHQNQLDSYNKNKKKFYDCNRIHNFIADEDDYENIQPFAVSQFGGSSNSKQYINQQYLNNSNLKSYHISSTTYTISSFLREIDEINTFSQGGFL
ncbi:hypothetical protein TTHERM_00441710 (macronuclear) [Tetrahymena thermophila SB210]|uniref:Uncharacterized protein n=1 Tax=Tetrahymena thermophila (strain SB210) TaxID=312017 RepID=I7LTK6_TETTS|nr:hypothetical protein TTHERM_00441710 [Tetrahymena thermophila SB210]EAR85424.1 hypothetical protein TTHERM_00441710 [Tetrahymena thermophila SB210]|eukprot:XP_001033087.1 hypothetical protein TTHERM_00441710 [Tetrahymena thermophila SB210]